VSFSPDGRYILFNSDESGGNEAYVAPVAAVDDKIRIAYGASAWLWSRDGSEILYFSGWHLMSLPVRTTPSLWLGQPSPLFTLKNGTFLCDVSPDGKRFLAGVSEADPTSAEELPLHVVLNWTAEALAKGGPAR
jgi:dipeptidyl aminopeptidase/acylaminoacyl peptidase